MASHHRRRRQQDSRVGMTAVEEEDEEEAETEEATASSPPAAAAAAATAQSVSSVIAGRRGSAFTPAAYAGVHHALFPGRRSHRTNPLRLVERLTKNLVETYRICNPEFKYSEELNPKRFLTSPADGVLNNGHDNLNSDLILNVNYVIFNIETRKRYIVTDILGHGTFGQVAKCWVPESNTLVAVKIIKNQPAYYRQALVEVSILRKLNEEFDPEDKHHIVRMYDCFVFQRHLCISFELLDTNLHCGTCTHALGILFPCIRDPNSGPYLSKGNFVVSLLQEKDRGLRGKRHLQTSKDYLFVLPERELEKQQFLFSVDPWLE
ncbi:hypothetical protein Dimus_020894 [Dionaea muscipula]